MIINPFVMGSGRAANALKKSMALLSVQHPTWDIRKPIQIERGQELQPLSPEIENPILIIANPPGLHSHAIHQGERAGFRAIVVEKPACVSLQEIEFLKSVQIPVAVCHIYRQMWGIQTLKQMLDSGEFGELICVEGRYWQSSTAQRAIGPKANVMNDIRGEQKPPQPWKNNPKLSGAFDAFLDVGVHWVDAVTFLIGSAPSGGNAWLSYANAEEPHRDSHVHLNLEFPQGKRAMASISKTVHGATNHFEINILGTKKSATWTFLNPDEIWIGEGNTHRTITRKDTLLGSQQPPFHGLGWLEGYMEILRQIILELEEGKSEKFRNYPRLQENLKMLDSLLKLRG